MSIKLLFITLLAFNLSAQDSLVTSVALKNWMASNLGVVVPEEYSFTCSFNAENYGLPLGKEERTALKEEYWLGTYRVNSVEATTDGIVMDISTDDFTKTLLLTENYFTVSYHLMLGSDGRTLIYNFQNNTLTENDQVYAIRFLSSTELLVGKDYYDTRDVEDPEYEGHIFELGSFNLVTGEYIFLEKE